MYLHSEHSDECTYKSYSNGFNQDLGQLDHSDHDNSSNTIRPRTVVDNFSFCQVCSTFISSYIKLDFTLVHIVHCPMFWIFNVDILYYQLKRSKNVTRFVVTG